MTGRETVRLTGRPGAGRDAAASGTGEHFRHGVRVESRGKDT